MRLELTRSGGIAGLLTRRSLDTDRLPAEERTAVEELVARANLEEVARRSPVRGRGADRFQYDLRVKRGEREERVVVAEDQASPELRAVVQRVLERGEDA